MNNYEQKYIFLSEQKQLLLDWLEYSYIPDPNYYFGSISSIYFDTPTLALYHEKRNSDYLKSKLRLRWYAKLRELESNNKVKCFLEVKKKIGSTRNKERLEIEIATDNLLNKLFSDDDIIGLPALAYKLDYFPKGMLVPLLVVQYERYRFVDPQSGSRIALDTNICCLEANSAYISGIPPIFLDVGVLEIKGELRVLLSSLTPIAEHITKEAFSKYGRCCESLMQPLARRL